MVSEIKFCPLIWPSLPQFRNHNPPCYAPVGISLYKDFRPNVKHPYNPTIMVIFIGNTNDPNR